jgi:hypothetical protein
MKFMKTLKNTKLFFFSLLLVTFFACDDSESKGAAIGEPTISIKLVDAPGDFEEVNINVVGVRIKMDDESDSESGWTDLDMENSGIINLLDLTGGVNQILVDRFPVPTGMLSQMRLVLGDGNTIVIKNDSDEDETFDLKTPSAQQSGLKLKIDAVIEEGFTYDYIIDFNVDKSIVRAGKSSNIILKPVLYVSAEVSSGIINGTVSPIDVPSIVSVLVDDKGNSETDDDFIITANTDDLGAFALWGVPAGTYEVIVTPIDAESDYTSGTTIDVVVTNGGATTIEDPIVLNLKPGSITGTVLGLADGVLATASIMVDTETLTDETDGNGLFTIDDVPVGDYTVTISAEGYVSQSVDVAVSANAEITLDSVTLVAVP